MLQTHFCLYVPLGDEGARSKILKIGNCLQTLYANTEEYSYYYFVPNVANSLLCGMEG